MNITRVHTASIATLPDSCSVSVSWVTTCTIYSDFMPTLMRSVAVLASLDDGVNVSTYSCGVKLANTSNQRSVSKLMLFLVGDIILNPVTRLPIL